MTDRTHYEILGIAPSASADEIKRQYRALARKHHPDANPDSPDAARKFALINESYRILGDADARQVYDAELALKAQQNAARAARASGQTVRPSVSRVDTGPRSGNFATPQTGPTSGAAPGTTAAQAAESAISQARTAFVRNKMAEARSFAEQALRYDRRNAGAYEVLGDICRVQGRVDDAMSHYTLALQLDPRKGDVRQRLERLARTAPPTPGGFAGTGRRRRLEELDDEMPSAPLSTDMFRNKRPLSQLLAGFVGYAGAFLIVFFAAAYLEREQVVRALPLPAVSTWSWGFIACLAIAGGLLGATMSASSAIRRIEDELLLSPGGSGPKTVPVGLLVLVVAAANFYIAALIHLGMAAVQETLSAALVRVYAAVAILTLCFALIAAPAAPHLGNGLMQTLLFGGNVIFLAFVIGWLLGDFFRVD